MSEQMISILDECKASGYEASLITTFNAYFPFYEDVVWRRLVSNGISNNIVLMDAKQLAHSIETAPPRSCGQNYTLIPVQTQSVFHPKVVLLAGKKKGLLIIGSHNLTLAGFGYNREITNVFQYNTGDKDSNMQPVFYNAWQQIKHWVEIAGIPQKLMPVFEHIEEVAPWIIKTPLEEPADKIISTNSNSNSLWHQLAPHIPIDVDRVFVTGAFFDKELAFIKHIQRELKPKSIIVAIEPKTVSMPSKLGSIPNVSFVDIGKLGGRGEGYLHAKILAIQKKDNTGILVSGSANPSRSAWLAENGKGNVEMVVVRTGPDVPALISSLGLDAFPEQPGLSSEQWEQVVFSSESEFEVKPSCKTDTCLLDNNTISWQVHDGTSIPKCTVLDNKGEELGDYDVSIENTTASITVPPEILVKALYIQYSSTSGTLYKCIIHNAKKLTDNARTGIQKQISKAFDSLDTDSPDVVTLIKCVDKILFSKTDSDTETVPSSRRGKTDGSDTFGGEGEDLSINIEDTRKIRKKYKLRRSDNLGYLLNVLIYHLRIASEERVIGNQDFKGRTEEEQIGEDDEEILSEVAGIDPIELLESCKKKVRTLINRLIKLLQSMSSGKYVIDDAIVRIVGGLAFLKELRKYDGKVYWIPAGQTVFDRKDRRKLFEAVQTALFDGDYSIIHPSKIPDKTRETDEFARLKGLILWLAWDCGHPVFLPQGFAEKFQETENRIKTNAASIALAQLIGDDNVSIEQAREAIAAMGASDMDWLSWYLNVYKGIRKLLENAAVFKEGINAQPGDLAIQARFPEQGVSIVLGNGETGKRLVRFDKQNKDQEYASSYIKVHHPAKRLSDLLNNEHHGPASVV